MNLQYLCCPLFVFQIVLQFFLPRWIFQNSQSSFNQLCYDLLRLIIFKIEDKENPMNTYYLLSLYLFLRTALLQNLTVNLNESLLLHHNQVGISTIGRDAQGNFLVSFMNNEARRYTSDFSSYITIEIPQPVRQFQVRILQTAVVLTNGTTLNLTDRKIILISLNLQTIRIYNYSGYIQEERYNLSTKIIDHFGFPITVLNTTYTYLIIISNTSVIVSYKGVSEPTSYINIIMQTCTCNAATFHSYQTITTTNKISVNHIFYLSLCNSIYQINITLSFQFSTFTNHFEILSGLTAFAKTVIYTSSLPMTFLQVANGLLIMQSNSTGTRRLLQPAASIVNIYNIAASTMATVTGIPSNQIFRFFYIYGAFYLLQSVGILKLAFNPTTNTISVDSYTANLPYNLYRLRTGNGINVMYAIGQPYIYKAGACTGSYVLVGTTCTAYNCSVTHCSSCPISPVVCSSCQVGYSLSSSYQCAQQITNGIEETNVSESFFNFLKDLLKLLISVPTARRVISPLFYFFGVFDDIYLFQFHDRTYGETMNSVFETLNEIQTKKWSLVNYETVLALLRVDAESFANFTEQQSSYNEYAFAESHTDVGAEGLWQNCQNFFVVALPMTVAAFVVGRTAFRALFNHAVSRWVRRFEFWSFLLLLLFDGSIQQFAFYQSTDWKNAFSFDAPSKLLKAQTVFFGFCVALVSFSLFFLSYSVYSKLNAQIMDNNRNTIVGHAALIAQLGARNFVLGVLHSFLRGTHYRTMVAALLTYEFAFLFLFAAAMAQNAYIHKLKVWVYVLLNFNKALLIVTLLADYRSVNVPIVEAVQQFLVAVEIAVYLFGVAVQTLFFIKEIIKNFKMIFESKQISICKNRKLKVRFKTRQSLPKHHLQGNIFEQGHKQANFSKLYNSNITY